MTKAFLVQLEHICFRRIERLEVWHKIVISELREDGGSSIA